MDFINKIIQGDCIEKLKELPDSCVDCCVTSPPYYGLRDYGEDGQIGLEETPEAYVQKLVDVFREVKRVLKPDGTLWLNLGDSYFSDTKGTGEPSAKQDSNAGSRYAPRKFERNGLKPKDLIGIPWMVAFALRADGWYLRQDIIWCLSGGTWIYAKTQKGEMPMMVRDLIRLKPDTVKLWNGEKWTRLLGINKSERIGNEIELVLRSGERISCTPTHKFPTERGLVESGNLVVGDTLQSCKLPEPELVKDCVIDEDAAWLAGLYIAEGSKSEDTIQISGHIKEEERWLNIQRIARKYGGTATKSENGNIQSIRIYGKILCAIINELVTGVTSHDKAFAPVVWRYSNKFIESMLDGYLSGDGHWDENNKRYRLGFTRNYNLERDLRVVCARLGHKLTLNLSSVKYDGKDVPTFRGEIRKERSGHFNEKSQNEIVEIRKSRCRNVYDLGVEDKPNLFALASGVLTHNSKPNPMPESVTDRCTKAHEYIFLLSKSQQYYYDYESLREKAITKPHKMGGKQTSADRNDGDRQSVVIGDGYANKRSVWTVTTKPFSEAHFATFPEDLIVPCIKAGCPEKGIVLDPFMGAGTTAVVARKLSRDFVGTELNPEYIKIALKRVNPHLMQKSIFDYV